MYKKILSVLLLLFPMHLLAQDIPELVDISLNTSHSPHYFDPLAITLEKDITYLIVLKNDSPREVTFVCKNLKDAVYTQFIQGSPSVSQDRISIRGKGRVQWLITANAPGQFEFYEAASEFSHDGAKIGKLKIHDPDMTADNTQQHIAELVLAKLAEKEQSKNIQRQNTTQTAQPMPTEPSYSTVPQFNGGKRD